MRFIIKKPLLSKKRFEIQNSRTKICLKDINSEISFKNGKNKDEAQHCWCQITYRKV